MEEKQLQLANNRATTVYKIATNLRHPDKESTTMGEICQKFLA